MVDTNITHESGGGMSRAALKKKKKRKQQQQQQQQQPRDSMTGDSTKSGTSALAAPAAASDHPTQQKFIQTKETKKRKSPASDSAVQSDDCKFGIIDDDDIQVEGCEPTQDNVEDEDEQIPMKKAAEENVSSSLLPNECRTLHEILLLSVSSSDSASTDKKVTCDNNNNMTSHFSNMTIEQRAQCALEFLLQPSSISKTTFYTKYYERLPLLVHSPTMNTGSHPPNQHGNRYNRIFGISDLRDMIQNQTLHYGTDLNVTRYEKSSETDGVYRRITLDKKKKNNMMCNDDPVYEAVKSDEVWDFYHHQQCTIRLLCPQQYNDTIHALLSLLEHEFHCMVGANIYCTPPNSSQGFAPHYDDIDAYILQLEGYKRWKVYKPLHAHERLPRTSSRDYTTQDLMHIQPVLDVVLGPGDLLYMPRGWIHQACTIPMSKITSDDKDGNQHSLHLTISTMQQWAWADYLEILLPEALQSTIQSSNTMLLREGLPNGFLQYMGAMYDNRTELLPDVLQSKLNSNDRNDDALKVGSERSHSNAKGESDNVTSDKDDDTEKIQQQQQQRQILQEEFRIQTKRRLMRVVKEAMTMIDAACDQMGKRFLSERLPPALTESERHLTNASTTVPQMHHTVSADALCQIVRPGIARLVLEDEMAIVYHCNDNSRVYQEQPISPLEFEMDDAPSIEQLLTTAPPHWIAIQDLIHDTIDDKVSIAQSLYDEGILAIRKLK